MDWFGASVIAPRPFAPIEFEIAVHADVLTGYFNEARFFSEGDAAGYPRKLVRRWRYLAEESAPLAVPAAIGT